MTRVLDARRLEDIGTSDLPPLLHIYDVPPGCIIPLWTVALCGHRCPAARVSLPLDVDGRSCRECDRIAGV